MCGLYGLFGLFIRVMLGLFQRSIREGERERERERERDVYACIQLDKNKSR